MARVFSLAVGTHNFVGWWYQRTSGTGYVISSPVDIILIERPTLWLFTLPCPMLTRAISIPTERTQTALHTPRKSQLSFAPPTHRVDFTHTGFIALPPHPSPRHIISRSPPRFLTRPHLCPGLRTTISNCTALSQRRRCSTASTSTIMPGRYTNDCAHRHRKPISLRLGRQHVAGICVCHPPPGVVML